MDKQLCELAVKSLEANSFTTTRSANAAGSVGFISVDGVPCKFLIDQRLAPILEPSFPKFIIDRPQLETVSAFRRLLIRQAGDSRLSNPWPCESVRGRWDDRKR
jgi:hypothetical protein